MNPLLLSQHQFADMASYMDTLIVTVHDPTPLDIAAPLAASELIGFELCNLVQDRFCGRSACRTAGPTTVVCPTNPSDLDRLSALAPFQIRYGLCITDRALLCDHCLVSTGEVTWLIFDWWHFIRSHVPDERLTDAIMYLSVTNQTFFESDACNLIGFPQDVQSAMRAEGGKLMAAMEQEISRQLGRIWTVDPWTNRQG